MRSILVAAGLLFASFVQATAQNQIPPQPLDSCKPHAPWGMAQISKPNTTPICRMAYLAIHDNDAKIPVYVTYQLTQERAIGCYPREDAFQPDYSIPKGKRAELSDYAKSGYDIGHVANNADMSWDPRVQRESFILSNMYPQLPGLNRGLWKQLESVVRSWAYGRQTNLLVIAGAIYDTNTDKFIGANKVIVPKGFYKIVVDLKTGENQAFYFPHQGGLGSDINTVKTTVAAIEASAQIRFQIPGDKNIAYPTWPGYTSALAEAKKAQCKG